jgi:RNA polymerase sigma factor (sigma-70 family)
MKKQPQMPDEQIIALIRTNKNDNALRTLYSYFPMILKMIRRHGGTSQDAEDVFQEALIILIRRIRETDFTLTAKASTYLFSVSRFLWKDELKKRMLLIPPDLDSSLLSSAQEYELEQAIESENSSRLAEKALNALQDRCRELLILFYEQQRKLKDIAAKMGYSSEHTAKNQKYKCLENARQKLKELKQIAVTP